jgi:hypothetical protein
MVNVEDNNKAMPLGQSVSIGRRKAMPCRGRTNCDGTTGCQRDCQTLCSRGRNGSTEIRNIKTDLPSS